MSYPSVTLGGLPIEELQAVEIWKMSRILSGFATEAEAEADYETAEDEETIEPDLDEAIEDEATEEAEEPESSLFSLPTTAVEEEGEEDKERLIDVRGRDFAVAAKITYTRRGEEIDSAVIGDQLVFRLPLEDLITGEEVEEVLVFGARSVGDKKRASPFSNLVKLFPRTPPPAPANFSVEARPDGIQLDWEEVDGALGYRVYRRYS